MNPKHLQQFVFTAQSQNPSVSIMSKFKSDKNKSLVGSRTMNPSQTYRKCNVRGHVYMSSDE